MSDLSPRLALPLLAAAQAQKHVTHNEALALLDLLVQLTLEDFDAAEPPALPQEGAVWALGPAPTGAWAGQGGMLAARVGGAWRFLAPGEGWRATRRGEAGLRVNRAGDWLPVEAARDNLPGLGVNATADAVNRLAVSAPATLLSHAGAGHQLKVNKAAPGDTASLLFQTGFSGRAEMGTAGNDDWSIKVSADGQTWIEALRIAAASGRVSGAAVQESAADTTPGRLMRADFGYSPGNLLGAVSQAGGVPTGAVIQRGSSISGEYVRFADGTQICWHRLDMGIITAGGTGTLADPYRTAAQNWTFPASFSVSFLPEVIATAEFKGALINARRVVSVAKGPRNATTVFNLQLYRWADFSDADQYFLSLMAIGRWF